jgi:hypothetical protein
MRKAMSILGLTTGLVILAQPALAVGWGKESTYYNNIKRATGWGDFRNENNARALNEISINDDAHGDGNKVYGVTEFLFRQHECQAATTDCREDFHWKGTKTTPEIADREERFFHRKDLTPTASRVRAKTFACVQMGWPVPDGCARPVYPTFDY